MIHYRQLTKDDDNFFRNFISYEGKHYDDFLSMGWSTNQIINQINKKTNFSFGAFNNKTLVSFILGDLFNIEKTTPESTPPLKEVEIFVSEISLICVALYSNSLIIFFDFS